MSGLPTCTAASYASNVKPIAAVAASGVLMAKNIVLPLTGVSLKLKRIRNGMNTTVVITKAMATATALIWEADNDKECEKQAVRQFEPDQRLRLAEGDENHRATVNSWSQRHGKRECADERCSLGPLGPEQHQGELRTVG